MPCIGRHPPLPPCHHPFRRRRMRQARRVPRTRPDGLPPDVLRLEPVEGVDHHAVTGQLRLLHPVPCVAHVVLLQQELGQLGARDLDGPARQIRDGDDLTLLDLRTEAEEPPKSSTMGVLRHRRRRLSAAIVFFVLAVALGSALVGTAQEVGDTGLRPSERENWVARRRLAGPGSSPPTCRDRCGRCFPCWPVHVVIQPGRSVPLEYYPEAWRCKCGSKLFMP
ncbi:hypothetical protein C4D60_Mb07t01910 [Musa balbisiana]|uniref:Epidermal patterning factor-like protein n=1 Tax=Musa balbisiana TaxID=52838 RepID=A0A4S8JE49_MUSBA|nr:hypothetical protein C4D60_Mb07t01910 [Musa balbisiana]